MRASSSFVFAILALVRVAFATPPACLLAAMGAQVNPSDLKALCGTLESQVVGNITEKCSGAAYSSATSVYAATCLASESVTISITQSAKSSSSTGSVSAKTTSSGASVKTTGTGTTAATAAANTGSTATGTSTAASSTSTSNAGNNGPQFILAALALGVAGLVL